MGFVKEVFIMLFLTNSWKEFFSVLIVLAGIYSTFIGIMLAIIGIRRFSKSLRHETVTDLICSKLIAVSFLYTSLASLFFMPYIAIIFWIIGYFLMKRWFKKDIFALSHIQHTHSLHPWSSLRGYKENLSPHTELTGEELISFQRIHLCSSIMLGIVFWCGVLTSSQDTVPNWLFLVNANISFFTFILSCFVLHIVADDLLIIPDNGRKWGWLAVLILIFGVGGNMLVMNVLNLI